MKGKTLFSDFKLIYLFTGSADFKPFFFMSPFSFIISRSFAFTSFIFFGFF